MDTQEILNLATSKITTLENICSANQKEILAWTALKQSLEGILQTQLVELKATTIKERDDALQQVEILTDQMANTVTVDNKITI